MNPLVAVAFLVVWVSVMIYMLQKKQHEREIAAKHPADRSPAVREAYRRQLDRTGKAMLITGGLLVASFIFAWIEKGRSEPLFIAGVLGMITFGGLLLASFGFGRRCPVCTATLHSGARFCVRCGAQLQP
jgi:hypothetical protein